MKTYQEALLKMFIKIKAFVKENYKLIFDYFYFVLSIIAILNAKDQNKKLWLFVLVITYMILRFLFRFINSVKEIKHPKIRYTKINESGDVIVEEEKLHQALIHLSILEDQLERR